MGGVRRVLGEEPGVTDVLVVGGGAAGLSAALFAARAGARVTLLERNEKLGKKIYITGKGRCNVTNTAEREDFMKQIVRNPRFLYAALSHLGSRDLMALLEALGVPLKEERGGRVFPVSDRASDVTRALEREILRLGATVRLNARAHELLLEDGAAAGVRLESGEEVRARAVIVATGGLSYPSTGSTGDGYRLAEAAGLALSPTRATLTPIETIEDWPGALSGLTLKNVRLGALNGKKKLFAEQGELLFTHFGLSGPLALSLSSALPDDCAGQRLTIDLKPALDEQTLDRRLVRDLTEMSRKQLITVMDALAPHNLALTLLNLAGLSPAQPAHSVTQAQRAALVKLIKAVPLTVKGLRGYLEAVVTRGGVDVKGINASTMEAKAMPHLYFAGEVLDVDALTGGFNLQIAFSTGALAGASAGHSRSAAAVRE